MKRELNFAIYLSHSIYNGLVEAFGIYLFRHTLRCMSKDVLHNIHRDITTIKKQSGSGMTGPVQNYRDCRLKQMKAVGTVNGCK